MANIDCGQLSLNILCLNKKNQFCCYVHKKCSCVCMEITIFCSASKILAVSIN